MAQLIESIKERGVITPATVRQKEDGRYELISGHRRKRACELAGFDTLRCEVVELNRDEATILMVESNYQRSQILPSEKAYAYKMRLEALSRQGKRTDLTSDPVGWKSSGKETAQLIGEQSGDSQTQVRRYIRLTNLVPELLEYVDEGRIKMRPAVELSFLDEDSQRDVVDAKILFSKSNLLVSKLFEPGTDGNRKSLEKHHLFPKAYLKSLGYPDSKINQMANYAFIDWKDNMDILDDAPSVYYPIVCEGKSEDEIRRMEEENALPHGWENMVYEDFLEVRRKLMAAKIKTAFEQLKKNVE